MAHYFDVISCGIKQMHAQFSLLFGFHNAMVLLNKLSRKIKLNTVEDSPEKTLRKNLTATPFSYMNDASVDLNELCLHITYLFLKELVFVSDVFLLALLSHENLHLLPAGADYRCRKLYQESFHRNGLL